MLPVDALREPIIRAMNGDGLLVLEAPPGAGKTTRVPRFILDSDVQGEIIVVQPRRIAARMAARFVAHELGERPGETIGYQVRFEEAVSSRTRVRFVTEGLLVRELERSPTLKGVGCVVFDEFHERHLDADLALALCKQLRDHERPDLRIVVMSATLDAEPIAAWLGAERLRSEGRQYPVTVSYVDAPGTRRLDDAVASVVRKALREYTGDILVFLPGVGEIMGCLSVFANVSDLLAVPLHGELSPEDQDRAVSPADRRKVVFSTNVAETSVTINGIGVVIDTGLARVASHDPWSGMPQLRLQRISRASADQRAGRAGRTREGFCLRMYGKAELAQPFDVPEIRRLDLASAVLTIRGSGHDPLALPWFEAPNTAAVAAAETLLRDIGALDAKGVTQLGRAMMRYPTHPRLARFMVEAVARNVARDAALVAALLAERDVTVDRRARVTASADVIAIADMIATNDTAALKRGAVRQVLKARDQLARIAGKSGTSDDTQLRLALLSGYPDRVAKKLRAVRDSDSPLATVSQGPALLSQNSVVQDATWILALDAEQRSGRDPLVRSACAIDPDWLIELFTDRISDETTFEWNPNQERVDAVSRMAYGALVMEETRKPAQPSAEASKVLLEQLEKRGLGQVLDAEALAQLEGRVALARAHGLDVPDVRSLLAEALTTSEATSFAAVRDAALLDQVMLALGPARATLDHDVPAFFKLANGKSLRIHYEPGKAPWVESYLQDFFGTDRGPRIARGGVALTIHLWGPNKRPLQVTSDLASFWDTHYPELKPALARRYPRHHWPDDPRKAEAQAFKSRLKS